MLCEEDQSSSSTRLQGLRVARGSLKPEPTGVRKALRTELDLLISWSLKHSLLLRLKDSTVESLIEESRLPGEYFPSSYLEKVPVCAAH